MPTLEEVTAQLNRLKGVSQFLARREIRELPNILWDSEQIHDMAQGLYDSGQGLLVSTDRRVLFINRGLIYGLKVEDFPNDKITSIQYETKLFFGIITIFASGNKAVISQILPKARATAFAEGVRARLAAATTVVPAADATASGDDLVAQLEKLGALKDKGILTDDEFAAKKKQLLGI